MPDTNLDNHSRAEQINTAGAQLFQQGQVEAAKIHFLAVVSLKPDDPMAWQNLGAVLRTMGHHAAANVAATRSVLLSPKNPFCKANLGVSKVGLRDFVGAKYLLKQVAMDLPDSGPSWHNYGLVLYILGEYREALECFTKSLELNPDNVHCLSDKALTHLALGELDKGLELYDVRWKILGKSEVWDLNIIEWQGEELRDKHILIHHEQGLGDSLMLSRYITEVLGENCKVTLVMPPQLVTLMENSFPKVKVISFDDVKACDPKEFDYHSPLLSVFRHLGYTSPSEVWSMKYLAPNETKTILLPQNKVKIGLCWASGNHGPGLVERRRIVSILDFLPILEFSHISLISLQKGEEAKDLLLNGLEGLIYDPMSRVEDFNDTGLIISQLDLVISVDSAVAHLAGAMGKPVLMLSPYSRCWRWWNRSSGAPWYNNLVQFHQDQDGTWTHATNLIVKEVKNRFC